jgi:hypothetical protein
MKKSVVSCLRLSPGDDGALSREVAESLGDLGWQQVHGSWDYIYRWDAEWESEGKKLPQYSEEVKQDVHRALRDHDVSYVFRTFWSTAEEDAS